MSIVLAIDSGSSAFGWCAVRREGARARYVDSGTREATRADFLALVESLVDRTRPAINSFVQAAYVETPDGYVHAPYRGPTLLETSRLVGGIDWECQRLGIPVHLRTAGWWRKALIGKASSPKAGLIDKLVADAVRANIIDMPKRSNVHVRDSLGLACVACWEMSGRRAA